jgi:hypothetical protein
MFGRGIIVLLLLTAVLVLAGEALGGGPGNVTAISACNDVYLDMGTERVTVFNQTDILLCAVDITEANGTRTVSNPGCPVIQFNISGLNLTDDDMAVMLLKATSILRQDDPVMVVLMTIGSDWDESSDYTTFLVNILPAWKIIKEEDATAMNTNTDGDFVFAFDVSKKIRDAEAGKVSFLLQAISNSSASISFLSRESGEGPYLVIMPYPELLQNETPDKAHELPENVTPKLPENVTSKLTDNATFELAEAATPELPENVTPELPENVTSKLTDNATFELAEAATPELPENVTPELPENVTSKLTDNATFELAEAATPELKENATGVSQKSIRTTLPKNTITELLENVNSRSLAV